MKPAADYPPRVALAVALLRVLAVYLLLGLIVAWLIAWGLAVARITGDNSWSDYAEDQSILLNDRLERKVQIGMDRWLGRTLITYATSEELLDESGYASHPYLNTRQFNGVFGDETDWSEALWFWNPAGFGGWGQRRVALRDGAESPWAAGTDHASGFPALALWNSWPAIKGQLGYEPDFTQPPVGGIDLDRLLQGSGPQPQRPYGYIPKTLPYRPIWLGLAINTAFYALLLFAFVRVVKGARHLRRFRRGKCPRCGYDLLATFIGPCPECGHLACALSADAEAQPP